jgi:hypothetical protein
MCRRVTVNFSGRGSAGNFLEVAEIWLENRIAICYLLFAILCYHVLLLNPEKR